MMRALYVAQVFNDLGHEMRISTTDQLEVSECLGEGNFGKVYQGLLHRRVRSSVWYGTQICAPIKDPIAIDCRLWGA